MSSSISFSDIKKRFNVTTTEINISTHRSKYGNNGAGPISMSTLFPNIDDPNIGTITNAYCTRCLSRNKTGKVLRLRKNGTIEERDVYTTMGGVIFKIVDTVNNIETLGSDSLSTWLNGNTALVSTWYDQVGSDNLIQSTDGNRPIYELSTNSVYFNNNSSTSISLSYNKAWTIKNATFVINLIPTAAVNTSKTVAWYQVDPIIGGERAGGTNDFGVLIPGGDSFGFGSGSQDGLPIYISAGTNATPVVMGLTRTLDSSVVSTSYINFFKDGIKDSNAYTRTGASSVDGSLVGPSPTYIARNSQGSSAPRAHIKIIGLVYADSKFSDANVTKLSYIVGN